MAKDRLLNDIEIKELLKINDRLTLVQNTAKKQRRVTLEAMFSIIGELESRNFTVEQFVTLQKIAREAEIK